MLWLLSWLLWMVEPLKETDMGQMRKYQVGGKMSSVWNMLSLSCQWSVQETIGDTSVKVRCESGYVDMCFEGCNESRYDHQKIYV